MSNGTQRLEGTAEKLGGKLKTGVGRLLGNRRMQAEGRATELRGRAREEAAKTGERVKGKAEELTGAAKKTVGRIIGNEPMQSEGRLRELKGEARGKINK